jgi:hypothetical protein
VNLRCGRIRNPDRFNASGNENTNKNAAQAKVTIHGAMLIVRIAPG